MLILTLCVAVQALKQDSGELKTALARPEMHFDTPSGMGLARDKSQRRKNS